MLCKEKITIKELLDSTRIFDQWCSKKVQRINRILRNFYLATVDLPWNIIAETFTGKWLYDIRVDYPIYKIHGFFGCGNWNCFISQSDKCSSCDDTKQIKLYRVDHEPREWQYKIVDCNTVRISMPCDASNQYILYSRWPITIQWINDEIEIDSFMRTWLEYFIEAFYEREWGEVNRMGNSERMFNEWKKSAMDAQNTWTFSVSQGINVFNAY